MADDKKAGLSFGFSKKIDSKKLQKSAVCEADVKKEEIPDFVFSLEGKEVKSSKPKEEAKQFVIPLIKQNNWRTPFLERKENGTPKANGQTGDDLSEQAAKEIIEAASRQNQDWDDRGKPDPNLSVPLLVRNKVPDGFETDDKLDVSLRPEGPEEANYDEIPIEQFGFAMLRGMGWKDGEGIGKNKELVSPLQATLRPKGLGLGADRSVTLQKQNGTITDSHNHRIVGDEDALPMKKGAYCLVLKGSNKDMYGIIEGLDEDNARVMVKLTLSGKIVTLSQYSIQLVGKKDYDKFSKYLNKGKVDKFKEEEQKKENEKKRRSRSQDRSRRSRDRSRSPYEKDRKQKSHKHRKERSRSPYEDTKRRDRSRSPKSKEKRLKDHRSTRHEDDDKERKRKLHYEEGSDSDSNSNAKSSRSDYKKVKKEHVQSSNANYNSLWVRPDIRVRIVDKNFKNGKYFKSKVVVIDVVSKNNCVCKTEDGRVLEGLSQSILETVIPKEDHSHALIVTGKYKGQFGKIVEKNKKRSQALLQLLSDRDTVLKLDFEEICEYVGNIDDQFDY